eukprot:6211757-Pleurochrysis_carterae.AAC.5
MSYGAKPSAAPLRSVALAGRCRSEVSWAPLVAFAPFAPFALLKAWSVELGEHDDVVEVVDSVTEPAS